MSKKAEKEQIKMDRIRAARGLPPLRSIAQLNREQMMMRVAAARCYVDRACSNEKQARRAELSAFMSIFHPEVPPETVRKMIVEINRHD